MEQWIKLISYYVAWIKYISTVVDTAFNSVRSIPIPKKEDFETGRSEYKKD